MYTKNALIKTTFVVITILSLVACATQASPTGTSASAAVATSAPLAASSQVSAATAAPTTTTASASAASNPTYLVKPDDQAMARLRIGNCVFGGTALDIYINGQPITQNGGVPFQTASFSFSGYLFLQPATVKLTISARGAGPDKLLAAPLDLSLEAGHRYTVAVLGQPGDSLHKTLVVDETKAIKDVGATLNNYVYTLIDNIKGTDGIDKVLDGKVVAKVPFGGFQAAIIPPMPNVTDNITLTGAPDKILDSTSGTPSPDEGSADSIACYGGTYPGTFNSSFGLVVSADSTSLSALDFLRHYTDEWTGSGFGDEFNTFLGLVKTAGMTDVLNNSPHLIFAPDDTVFASMPKDKLAALQADPKAAAAFLQGYIVEGYFPSHSLEGALGNNVPDRTLTAMSGASLKLSGDPLTINGIDPGAGWQDFTANGTRLQVLEGKLITP